MRSKMDTMIRLASGLSIWIVCGFAGYAIWWAWGFATILEALKR